jgi:hypothetical protein
MQVYSLKPNTFTFRLEIDPFYVIKAALSSIHKSNGKTKAHSEYNPNFLQKRSSIFIALRDIYKKLGFRKQTYMLSLGYYDKIMSLLSKEIKAEMYGLVCLMVAGK